MKKNEFKILPNPKTNVEKVTDFMNYGNPLKQAFVMEAIGRYADQLLKDEAKTLVAFQDTFVSGPAWIECAKQWKKV